jgi:hypothetical protein
MNISSLDPQLRLAEIAKPDVSNLFQPAQVSCYGGYASTIQSESPAQFASLRFALFIPSLSLKIANIDEALVEVFSNYNLTRMNVADGVTDV